MSLLVLLPIAFCAGVITVFTPCILPVLPLVLAGGATAETRRKPYAIVAGIVTTFTLFTLAGAWIFHVLHLSESAQFEIAAVLMLLLAATLVVPKVGEWVERPFAFLTRRRSGDLGGGFLLGASLGLVFAPCAGPVFAAVSAAAGTHRVGFEIVAIALAYAVGVAVPLLFLARGSRAVALRFRARASAIRVGGAIVMAATAVIFWQEAQPRYQLFSVSWLTRLQTEVPGYADRVQRLVERNHFTESRLAKLQGRPTTVASARPAAAAVAASPASGPRLPDYGTAPAFRGIEQWLNTPGGRPLTIAGLHGRVVLLDFWTYSCINCLRTLPHLEAWDRAYRKDGLTIIGVHTPEFAFEHVVSNVRRAAKDFGVRYPIAIDNDYATWNAWGNDSWPAEFLIDRNGHVRAYRAGEGDYDRSELEIRSLLAESGHAPTNRLVSGRDMTPRELTTPESYLGFDRLDRYAGPVPIRPRKAAVYRFPATLPQDELAYAGRWRIEHQRAVALQAARLRLHFHAKHVYLVLGGKGTVRVLVNGRLARTVPINGIARLYTVLSYPRVTDALLELRFSPGVAGYAFTFG